MDDADLRANPVTADELADIRTQFLGRCRIETSIDLMAGANPPAPCQPASTLQWTARDRDGAWFTGYPVSDTRCTCPRPVDTPYPGGRFTDNR